MADRRKKRQKNSDKDRNIGRNWRTLMDSGTVDLREIKGSKEEKVPKPKITREMRDIGSYADPHPATDVTPALADMPSAPAPEKESDNIGAAEEEFSKYIKELGEFRPFSRMSGSKGNSEEALSKEKLYDELSEIDSKDLRIQDSIVRTAVQEEKAQPSEELQRSSFQFIPRAQEDVQEILEQSQPEPEPQPQPELKPEPEPEPVPQPHPEPKQDVPEFPVRTASSRREEKELRKKILASESMGKRRFGKKVLVAVLLPALAVGGLMSQKMMSLKAEGREHAEKAYTHMKAGQDALFSLDAQSAEEHFSKATGEFQSIEGKFTMLGRDVVNLSASLPVQSELTSVAHLVRAGKLYSMAGYEASRALGSLQGANYILNEDGTDNGDALTDSLVVAALGLKDAGGYLREANSEIAMVRPEDIPEEFEKDIRSLQSQTGEIEVLFEETLASLDVLLAFLGHNEQKNYLLIFQNNSELRATGGFIGTYGLAALNKGSMEELFIDGIYNPDGQLKVNKFFVTPPSPLQYVTPYWGTRDANWFFDFPTSAEKIIWFYQQTGGPPPGETTFGSNFDIDGVIALNTDVLTELLALSGPIEMPAYNTTLTSENWLEIVQKEVEEDYDKELNRPKQILADMAPILMERLGEHEEKLDLINILLSSLESKDVLVYSRDEEVGEFLSMHNWDGAIYDAEREDGKISDYLAVAVSNIGGWKTDIYTHTEVDTVTKISESGDIVRTVIISRRHDGGSTPYMWYNKPNHGYVRIYAPKGSELISAEGFSEKPRYIEVDREAEGYKEDPLVSSIDSTAWVHESGTDVFEESDKTVFGGWLWIPAGERVLTSLTYKLPYRATEDISSYELMIQKQSGLDAEYSGSVEEFDSGLDITSCDRDGDGLRGGQFKFMHETDTTLTCSLAW